MNEYIDKSLSLRMKEGMLMKERRPRSLHYETQPLSPVNPFCKEINWIPRCRLEVDLRKSDGRGPAEHTRRWQHCNWQLDNRNRSLASTFRHIAHGSRRWQFSWTRSSVYTLLFARRPKPCCCSCWLHNLYFTDDQNESSLSFILITKTVIDERGGYSKWTDGMKRRRNFFPTTFRKHSEAYDLEAWMAWEWHCISWIVC